jgi:hypothetical protein
VKKVRYVFAAAGVAPALALMAPAATAAPVATHAPAGPGKSVRLDPATARHPGTVTPQTVCNSNATATRSVTSTFEFAIKNYGHCVAYQDAELFKAQTGLTERVRAYSVGRKMIFDRRVGGHIYNGFTYFPNVANSTNSPVYSSLGWNPVYQICATLVWNGTNTPFSKSAGACITP